VGFDRLICGMWFVVGFGCGLELDGSVLLSK
jgi:hypothetical protein